MVRAESRTGLRAIRTCFVHKRNCNTWNSKESDANKHTCSSDIEVSCFTYDGIHAIQEALAKGKSVQTEDIKISIRLIAPPLYVMSCMALNKDRGIQLLTSAIEEIRTSIGAKGGTLTVKEAPFVATKDTDDELEKLMSKLEEDNKEKDGDEPEEEGM